MKAALKFLISTIFFKRIVWTGSPDTGIYLTFDDGPHHENTRSILKALAEEECSATFFLLGNAAERHMQIVEEMLAAGHVIGNHGMRHQRRNSHSVQSYIQDVEDCQHVLQQCAGKVRLRKLFRPPYGELGVLDALILFAKGYKIIMWSLDSEDSFISDETGLLNRISVVEVKGGDVLLFHEDSTLTTKLLPKMVSILKGKVTGFSTF